jgi:FAD/FMN-containing dehydrogenase
VSGYNFDSLLEDEELNLAKLIVGSEGTLATVVEAELGLVPVPLARSLVLLSFAERWTSMDAIPAILPERGLSALEIVDSRVMQGARELLEFRPPRAAASGRAGGAVLRVLRRHGGGGGGARARLRPARAVIAGRPTAGVFLKPAEQTAAWSLRQAATGLLYLTTRLARHQAAGVRRGYGHRAGEAGRVHAALRGDRRTGTGPPWASSGMPGRGACTSAST